MLVHPEITFKVLGETWDLAESLCHKQMFFPLQTMTCPLAKYAMAALATLLRSRRVAAIAPRAVVCGFLLFLIGVTPATSQLSERASRRLCGVFGDQMIWSSTRARMGVLACSIPLTRAGCFPLPSIICPVIRPSLTSRTS